MTDEMRPLACAPDVYADPATAALLERRVADGEITVDELRAILRGEHNAPPTTADEARELLLAGERIRVVVGVKPGDPTLVVWRDGVAIMSESIAGWSEGVVEMVCGVASDYLLTFLSGRAHLYRHDVEETT